MRDRTPGSVPDLGVSMTTRIELRESGAGLPVPIGRMAVPAFLPRFAEGPRFDVAAVRRHLLAIQLSPRRGGGCGAGDVVPAGTPLDQEVVARLRRHIAARMDRRIEVATLARIAGLSAAHFSRVFHRSVGVTPHRYVVELRLRRAVELLRERRSSLAEIAARTGFADQSHLSRWVRRVHGASPTQMAMGQGPEDS